MCRRPHCPRSRGNRFVCCSLERASAFFPPLPVRGFIGKVYMAWFTADAVDNATRRDQIVWERLPWRRKSAGCAVPTRSPSILEHYEILSPVYLCGSTDSCIFSGTNRIRTNELRRNRHPGADEAGRLGFATGQGLCRSAGADRRVRASESRHRRFGYEHGCGAT